MHTDAHAFYTWFLAKHGVKAGRAAGIAGAVGAALPDVPSLPGRLIIGFGTAPCGNEESLEAIYFSGPFDATGSALHSIVPVGTLLALYTAPRLGRFDRGGASCLGSCWGGGHTIAGFLRHVDATRPLFRPISD